MVIDKIDFVALGKGIFNLKGHKNKYIGSTVKVILLNEWILFIGVAGTVLQSPLSSID